MPGYILTGEENDFDGFIDKYKKENLITDLNTTIYRDKILIEDSRKLIKSLSLKSSSKKLFVFRNEITIEAQNSLLKNIEELESHNNIIFCTPTLSALLPTVQSRCFIVNFVKINIASDSISSFIKKYIGGKVGLWELIEKIEEAKLTNPSFAIQSSLRKIVLVSDTPNQKKAYFFSKRLLSLSPLIEKNNINLKIALEKVFAT